MLSYYYNQQLNESNTPLLISLKQNIFNLTNAYKLAEAANDKEKYKLFKIQI